MEEISLEAFCQLIPADRDYPTIHVRDGEPLVIGRSPLTKITDGKCSRNQLEVVANFSTQELTLKQVGTNSSLVASKLLHKHETYILGNNGSFELLQGKYKYHVIFGKRVPKDILKQLQEDARVEEKEEDKEAEEMPPRKMLKLENSAPVSKDQSDHVESSATKCESETCIVAKEDDKLRKTRTRMKRKQGLDAKDCDDNTCHSQEDVSQSNSSKRPKLDLEVEEVKAAKNKASEDEKSASSRSKQQQQASLDNFVSTSKKSPDQSRVPDLVDSSLKPKWEDLDTIMIMRYGGVVHSTKIASFDLDYTLIETSSGRKFATGPSDWKFMKGVFEKLRSIHSEGYKIVIFTNQAKLKKEDFHKKLAAIMSQLRVPVLLMASLAKDHYRKPCTGMWEYLVERENGREVVDMATSFYVGDAAGRLEGWRPGAKKDFSCSDRKFASNLQLPFMTPEEFFLKHSKCTRFSWGEFNPKELDYSQTTPQLEPPMAKLKSDTQEVVVFTGCPASGKSTFYASYMKPAGYIHINRDKLKTWQKCVAECDRVLKAGKSAVIDNTNPDKESRLRYINCAKKNGVRVRCFQFMTSIAHAKHNNRFRELTVESGSYVKVNDMVFNMYKSKFTEPEKNEGFEEIVKVTFTPEFSKSVDCDLYKMFLL